MANTTSAASSAASSAAYPPGRGPFQEPLDHVLQPARRVQQPASVSGAPASPSAPFANDARVTTATGGARGAAAAASGGKIANDAYAQYAHAIVTENAAALRARLTSTPPRTDPTMRAAVRNFLDAQMAETPLLHRHRLAFQRGNSSVHLGDTYATARSLGLSVVSSAGIAVFSHVAALAGTRHVHVDDAVIDNMRHPDVHSGAFDAKATVAQEVANARAKVDTIMTYAQPGPDLTRDNITAYVNATAAASPSGWLKRMIVSKANQAEFGGLFDVCGGTVSREQLTDFYLGSLFIYLQEPDALAAKLVAMRAMQPSNSPQ